MQNISILIGHHFLLDSWAPLYFSHILYCVPLALLYSLMTLTKNNPLSI